MAEVVEQRPFDARHRHSSTLSVIVVGASGDLAKRKVYPSLFALYVSKKLPFQFQIHGFARSPKSHQEHREQLRPFLLASRSSSTAHDDFLTHCFYHRGTSYGDAESWRRVHETHIMAFEQHATTSSTGGRNNRMYYFAIPPNVFGETGQSIQPYCRRHRHRGSGWSKVMIEKPFGRDYQSCLSLLSLLDNLFEKDEMYRIDHYLGKSPIQFIPRLRFDNNNYVLFHESVWNHQHIQSMTIQFKEDIGTQGRGGYFDDYGIIRDVMQNHLLQMVIFLLMPNRQSISDAKLLTLKSLAIDLESHLIGQYNGYLEDISKAHSKCPTYALLRMSSRLPQWKGVPIVLEAGKALNERVCQAVVTFHGGQELILRVQPNPSISLSLKSNNINNPQQRRTGNGDEALIMKVDFPQQPLDAYATLLFEAIHDEQKSFVGRDELLESWILFDRILDRVKGQTPVPYRQGSTGPTSRQETVQNMMQEEWNNAMAKL